MKEKCVRIIEHHVIIKAGQLIGVSRTHPVCVNRHTPVW